MLIFVGKSVSLQLEIDESSRAMRGNICMHFFDSPNFGTS